MAKSGKDDKIMDTPDEPWTEFLMDGELLKIQKGHKSFKSSIKEATVSGSKILMKYDNTSFVSTFYQTCKDCLLLRHEALSDGNVKLALFRKSGKLIPEEVEKFKENARCLSLPVVNVLQDNHKPEQKAFTHADDVSPSCHDKKIHEFPITLKELNAKWYTIGSAYVLESHYENDKNYPYAVMDISVIEEKPKITYWNGRIGFLEQLVSENATFVERDGHVILYEPLYGYDSHIHKVSDDCIKIIFYNVTDASHAQGSLLYCQSHRGNDEDIEAFKQRAHCSNLKYITVWRNDFEYASKCHSVAHHLDPLDVKSILGLWHLVARAGKDDKIMASEDDPWAEFFMDGESLKNRGGNRSFQTSVMEVTVDGSKLLMKYDNTSFVSTFYPTCKDCLLLRHEAVPTGNVDLYLFKKSGKLTAEESEKFKDNVRCLSLPVVNVLQENHKPEQKEDPEKSHSKESSGKDHPN